MDTTKSEWSVSDCWGELLETSIATGNIRSDIDVHVSMMLILINITIQLFLFEGRWEQVYFPSCLWALLGIGFFGIGYASLSVPWSCPNYYLYFNILSHSCLSSELLIHSHRSVWYFFFEDNPFKQYYRKNSFETFHSYSKISDYFQAIFCSWSSFRISYLLIKSSVFVPDTSKKEVY